MTIPINPRGKLHWEHKGKIVCGTRAQRRSRVYTTLPVFRNVCDFNPRACKSCKKIAWKELTRR